MTNPATPNPVDQPFRRLFAGFDRNVEPPADLATRLRLRVLAEAELDDPIALRPVPAPLQESAIAPMPTYRPSPIGPRLPAPGPPRPSSSPPQAPKDILPPPSHTDEVGPRRRHPWYLIALEVAAVLLLLMGAAVVLIQRTIEPDRSAPRLGSAVTAVAGPSSEPQLLWERSDPDLIGTGDLAAGDDLLVRSVQDEHKSGFLWFERFEYDSYLQALDRRTGEQRWLVPVDGFGATYETPNAVLYVGYPNQEGEATSLIALSHADGAQLWRIDLPSPPAYADGNVAVRDDVVFLATHDAHIRAYDLMTGAEVWATPVGNLPGGDQPTYVSTSSLVLDGDRLLTLDPTGAVVKLDAMTGSILTTSPTSAELPAVVYEGRLIQTADRLVTVVTGTDAELIDGLFEDGPPVSKVRISAVDRATGDPSWSADLEGNVGTISAADDRLLVWLYDESPPVEGEDMPDVTGTIRVLDLATGAEVWSIPQPAGFPLVSFGEATTSDGQFLIGTQTGDIIALDIATGAELWRYAVGGEHLMMPPTVTGGLAIVSDAPGHLVAIAIPENE